MEDKKASTTPVAFKNPMMRKVNTGDKDNSVDRTGSIKKSDTITSLEREQSPHSNTSSMARLPTVLESYDVTKHLNLIEDKLLSKGMKFEDRKFMEQIADFLDSIIFDHIEQFGNFPHDHPILLRDFFTVYFVVYETMKINRVNIAKECYNIKSEKDQINAKLQKHQKTEKVFENGLTNNSKLKITIKNVHSSILEKNYVLNVQVLGEDTVKDIIILQDNVNRKFRVNVVKPNSTVKLSIIKMGSVSNNDEFKSEVIDLCDICERSSKKSYLLEEFGLFEFELIWIPSKVNYYNRLLNELDEKKGEYDESINILDSMIKCLEEPIPNIRDLNQGDTNNNDYKPIEATSSQAQLIYSEKLENFALKTLGKHLFNYDLLSFFLNKILMACLVIIFFNRADFASSICSIGIFSLEIKLMTKKQLKILLIGLLVSLGIDLLWFLYYFFSWTSNSEADGENGKSLRQLSILVGFVVIAIKAIITFLLWRSYISFKLKLINPEKMGAGRTLMVKSGNRDLENNLPRKEESHAKSLLHKTPSDPKRLPVRMFN